jgi:hypothetical protein
VSMMFCMSNRVVATSAFGDPAEAARIREVNEKRQAKEEKRLSKKKPKFYHWSQVLRYMHLVPETAKQKRQTKQRAKPGPAKSHKRAERQPTG